MLASGSPLPRPPILEAQADGIDRLDEHGFFVPVRPDQLDQAWLAQFLRRGARCRVPRDRHREAPGRSRLLTRASGNLLAMSARYGSVRSFVPLTRSRYLFHSCSNRSIPSPSTPVRAIRLFEVFSIERWIAGEGDTAVHHHERFRRHLQQPVGVGVGERQEAALLEIIEFSTRRGTRSWSGSRRRVRPPARRTTRRRCTSGSS